MAETGTIRLNDPKLDPEIKAALQKIDDGEGVGDGIIEAKELDRPQVDSQGQPVKPDGYMDYQRAFFDLPPAKFVELQNLAISRGLIPNKIEDPEIEAIWGPKQIGKQSLMFLLKDLEKVYTLVKEAERVTVRLGSEDFSLRRLPKIVQMLGFENSLVLFQRLHRDNSDYRDLVWFLETLRGNGLKDKSRLLRFATLGLEQFKEAKLPDVYSWRATISLVQDGFTDPEEIENILTQVIHDYKEVISDPSAYFDFSIWVNELGNLYRIGIHDPKKIGEILSLMKNDSAALGLPNYFENDAIDQNDPKQLKRLLSLIEFFHLHMENIWPDNRLRLGLDNLAILDTSFFSVDQFGGFLANKINAYVAEIPKIDAQWLKDHDLPIGTPADKIAPDDIKSEQAEGIEDLLANNVNGIPATLKLWSQSSKGKKILDDFAQKLSPQAAHLLIALLDEEENSLSEYQRVFDKIWAAQEKKGGKNLGSWLEKAAKVDPENKYRKRFLANFCELNPKYRQCNVSAI